MDLQDKLKYHYRPERKDTRPPAETRISGLCARLGAQLVDPDAAPVLRIMKFHPYDHFIPGFGELSRREVQIPVLSQHQFPETIALDRVLLFDLETTGLAGGAGTFPFLLGFGFFEPGGLRTVQYFLPDYGREHIAFLAMRADLDQRDVLLSFNGKAYDYPLLRNRFIMNRFEDPFAAFAHLDLLHAARRVWRGALPDCSLATIEREIFLFSRFGDLGGWLIPQAYFDFVRSGAMDDIVRIIDHNILDITSMARLFLHLHKIENITASDHEIVRLLHLAVKRRQTDMVETYLADLKSRKAGVPDHVMADLSLLLRRNGQWKRAIPIWEKLTVSRDHVLFAHTELAKYYEHHAGDLQMASHHTERALQYIRTVTELRGDFPQDGQEKSLLDRLTRLQRKFPGSEPT